MLRIITAGGRNFTDATAVAAALSHYAPHGPHTLVHGGCKVVDDVGNPYRLSAGEAPGADRLAHHLALAYGWEVEVHPADWLGPCATECPPNHRRTRKGSGLTYCPWAGPRRSAHMATLGGDGLILFEGGSGTERMAQYARQAGIPVWPVRWRNSPPSRHPQPGAGRPSMRETRANGFS